jgi:uncharacterized membrane protein
MGKRQTQGEEHMIKLIFMLSLVMLLVAGVFFFFKESDASAKWKAVQTVLYLLFFGFIAVSILTGIVILF